MNKKKLSIHIFLTGFLGYFLGGVLLNLFNKGNTPPGSLILAISGLVVAVIIGVLYHFYVKAKYPKLVKEMGAESKDERGQFIRGKASTYTLILIAILAAGFFIYTILMEFQFMSIMIGLSYVLTLAFNIGIHSYLEKRN